MTEQAILDKEVSARRSDVGEKVYEQDGELRQLVCFKLGDEDFGVDIYNVQEINRMVEITKIPKSPDFVEGVINLRGQIIPVIDLRKRFGFDTLKERTKETRIVVVETGKATVGFIVDQVTEVLRIPAGSIEPTPELVTSDVDARYIEGVAMLSAGAHGKDHLLIILDTDKIFSESETRSIEAIAA